MGDQTLDTLVLRLEGDSASLRSELKSALNAAKQAGDGIMGAMGGVAKAMGTVVVAASALAVGIAGTVTAFGAMIKAELEAIDANAKLADRLGLTTDEYSALALAADLANTSVETVTRASTFLQRSIAAAKDPTSEMAAAFAALNINVEQFSKLSTSDALGQISDKLMAIGDTSTRTALTMQLLGRGAGELDAFMRDGSAGIAEAKRQIDEMGGALSRIDMAKAEEANDAWTSMIAVIKRVKEEVAVQLAPAMTFLFNKAREGLIMLINNWGGIENAVRGALRTVLVFGDGWVRTAQTIAGYMGNLVNLMKVSWDAIGKAVAEVWAGIALAVDKTIFFMVRGLGQAIIDVGGDIAKLNTAAGQAVIGMGKDVKDSVETLGVTTQRTFTTAQNEAIAAGDAVKLAWANLFSVDASGSKALQDMIAKLDAAGNAAGEKPAEEGGGGGGGGTQTESPAVKKAREDQAAKLEVLRQSLLDEQALEVEAYLAKMEFLNGLEDEQFLIASDRQVMLEQLKQEHEAKMTGITEKASKARAKLAADNLKAQLEGASTFFSNMSSLMNTKSRTLFEIGKAAAYATTIVNTAAAAMACFKAGSEQGGPYLGAAYAAAAIAAGAVQLANISSASPGGGGSVSSGGGVPSISGQDPNSPNVGVNQNGTSQQDVTINIAGGSINKDQLIELMDELNRLKGDGVTLGNMRVT